MFYNTIDTKTGSLDLLLSRCGNVVVDNILGTMQFFTIDGIKTDFVKYDYPWIGDAVVEDGIRIASIEDIGAMKINAIINRGTRKDFIDMAFLLKEHSLDTILGWFKEKYASGNTGTALRSLAYFDDAETMPMPKMILKMTWDECKALIEGKLNDFAR